MISAIRPTCLSNGAVRVIGDCKAACVGGGSDRHRKERLGTLKPFLIVQ